MKFYIIGFIVLSSLAIGVNVLGYVLEKVYKKKMIKKFGKKEE